MKAQKGMPKQYGPWQIRATEVKFRDEFMEVNQDQVIRPDGKPGTYSTVQMKPGVAVLPIDERGTVYLTKQFRYGLGAESLEVVCGAIDPGERAAEAARRELREELGIQAKEWTELGTMQLDTSMICAPASLFVARQLSFGEPRQEGTETIRVEKLSLDEAVQAVLESRIVHGPSCVVILKAARSLEGVHGRE